MVVVTDGRLHGVLDPERCEPYLASEYECQLMGQDPANPPTLYRAGSDNLGYEGRTGIYELVAVDGTMRTMIHDGASELQLEKYARTKGPSIRDDGIRRVLDGVTTLEEVLRATQGD